MLLVATGTGYILLITPLIVAEVALVRRDQSSAVASLAFVKYINAGHHGGGYQPFLR